MRDRDTKNGIRVDFIIHIWFGELDISLYRRLYRKDNLVDNDLAKAIYTSIIRVKANPQRAEIRFGL
jgi:hypothetical protein|nr:hypothetical protein [uncultured Acetatifactor sp.]